MKVAIWGSYAYGNFGDELMALQFAVHLKRLGARPVVYRLHELLAERFEIETAPTAQTLLSNAAFCIFGGGSLLSPNKVGPRWYTDAKKREYREFITALELHGCPLYFLSIGGDGRYSGPQGITDYRKRLLSSPCCRQATVRHPQDVQTIKRDYGMDACYYPDVLLDVGRFWGLRRKVRLDGAEHIGINLPKQHGWLLNWLRAVKVARRGVVYHFLGTVRPAGDHGELPVEVMPVRSASRIEQHLYKDPIELLKLLSSLDLIVTTKLHIGLTALALGVPYLCVGRSLKAKAFLEGIGALFAYLGDEPPMQRRVNLLRILSTRKGLSDLRYAYQTVDLTSQKKLSQGHLDQLGILLKEHEAGRVFSCATPDTNG